MSRKLKTEADYRAMFARIEALETSSLCSKDFASHGRGYLADEAIDAENTEVSWDHPDYWPQMYVSLCMSAGQRAEEYGFSINEALGEVIY